MKKIVILLLTFILLLTSCGYRDRMDELQQFRQNEEKIDAVIAMLTPIAEDFSCAWELVKSGRTDITVEKLSAEVNLSAEELTEGIIYVYTALSGEAQETIAEAQRMYLARQVDTCLALQKSELVWIVSSSYKKAGVFEPIEKCIEEAVASVDQMQTRSERLYRRLDDCLELFRLCSQPSDDYESDISRIRELAGLKAI